MRFRKGRRDMGIMRRGRKGPWNEAEMIWIMNREMSKRKIKHKVSRRKTRGEEHIHPTSVTIIV